MNTPPVPRVLVVDDVLQVRQVFGRFLTMAGMEPSFAADGVDGLAEARVSPPDLVLCDLEMPRMDGVALCAALRADAAAAIAAGCDAVLPKPCSRALLIATVRDLLGSVEKARAVGAATTPPPQPVSTR